MANKNCVVGTVIIVAIVLAISIGLLVGAFEAIELLHFGILVDSAKISIVDSENYLYLSGRYHAGLGNNFYQLPAKRVTLVLSDDETVQRSADYSESAITTRTVEGIPLTTTVSCQVRLVNEDVLSGTDEAAKKEYNKKFQRTMRLLNFYNDYTYKPILLAILKSTLLDTLAKFKLNEIYVRRSDISEEMNTAIKAKYDKIGIFLVNFNIINISFQSSQIENAIETTQILGQKIEEMEFIKLSKQKQLEYLEITNKINDEVNKMIEVTKGEVNKAKAVGKGKGKAKLYENVNSSVSSIKTATSSDPNTFLFIYLGIFKNTFNSSQNIYVTQTTY